MAPQANLIVLLIKFENATSVLHSHCAMFIRD